MISMMTCAALTPEILHQAGLGSCFRPQDVASLGISFARLRQLADDGAVERLAHGLYRLADADVTENYSLAAVCARVPRAILCLLTALSYHEIGTQLPNKVWIAIPHKARTPRLSGLKLKIVRFSGIYLRYGVVPVRLEGVPARITNPARTVIDCFRFRRIVGNDVALEALKDAVFRRKVTPAEIWTTAEMCRAKTLVRPHLEMLSI